jgi:lysophospholipase L1-like esterase
MNDNLSSTADTSRSPAMVYAPTRRDGAGAAHSYVRFAALGDSVTHGLGDRHSQGYRGWARILCHAMQQEHEVSLCNLAVPGATTFNVRFEQLPQALAHRPHVASLIVGLNDALRSTWDAESVRRDLLHCAERLAAHGVLLLTVRLHDHSRLFHLPGPLARPLRARIAVLNEVYDEIQARFGGIQVDLAAHPGIYDREFWSVDRLHPSELGHRALADEFAALLVERGLGFDGPGLNLDGLSPTRWDELRWIRAEVMPWLGRRTRDLAPSIVTSVLGSARRRTAASRLRKVRPV